MTDFSARDLARDLLASGVRAGGDPLGDAFSDPGTAEDRMTRRVLRAAERELGASVPDADVRCFNVRDAAFIAAVLAR